MSSFLSVLLSDLDLASMQEMSREDRWGRGTKQDRRLYLGGDGLWYKIWGREYRPDIYIRGNRYCHLDSELGVPSFFLAGLYSAELCSAYVAPICDEDGYIRGYVSRGGVRHDHVPNEFCLQVFEAGLSAGFLCCDLTENNVIEIDGRLSLIDFDSIVASCEELDYSFQSEKGLLRSTVSRYYRELVVCRFFPG